MADKKNIWQRFLSSNKFKKNGLSIAEKKDLSDTLESEYGLTIQRDNESADELIKRNYRRIGGEELERIDQVFQFIPQIVANSANRQAVNAAFKTATQGTFHVRLGAGMHLCRSHLTPGAYRAVGLDNATNQIAGNAELFENSGTLSISKAPQIALGVFNVVSMVTGQYFMSQVNSRLSVLSLGVNKIEKLLDAQRLGKMKTDAQEVSDLLAKAEFIVCSTDKTNQAINQIQQIQRRRNDEMNSCQELIDRELRDMNINDKAKQLKGHIDVIIRNLGGYQCATQLYGLATLLEVQFRNVTDPEELRKYREQIDRRVNQFKQDYKNSRAKIYEYLIEAHISNDESIVQRIRSIPSAHRKRQKKKIYAQVNESFSQLGDALALESPATAINFYINAVGKEIEFVWIDGEYYTNLPQI